MATVLLIDSYADTRAMYAVMLRMSGFHVLECDNTADGLIEAAAADAVVTGIQVAGPFDGVEFVRRLRADARTSRTPVVALTACALDRDEARALAAGCDVFLRKPCPPDVLVSAVRCLLSHPVGRARGPRGIHVALGSDPSSS
jgi:two-component system, cell cycle response regulator DivK